MFLPPQSVPLPAVHTQKNFLASSLVLPPRGAPGPECLSTMTARIKIISSRMATCSENETAAFSHTGSPRAPRTALTRQDASPREKCNSAPGRWGLGGEGGIGPSGHQQCGMPAGPSRTPNSRACGGTAHLRRGSRCSHRRLRSRRPGRPAHPAVIPSGGKARPFRDRTYRGGAECTEKEGVCETNPETKPPQRREQEE